MSDGPPRIADNPSFTKLRNEIQGMKILLAFRPFLRLFGVRIGDDLVAKSEELRESFEKFSQLPDRFNQLFAERGWIAYELMNDGVMRMAAELGEAGNLEDAEKVLVEHYDRNFIELGIGRLFAIEAFRPRERLARLALEDYLCQRYHACVPVILMILDGVINEVHGTRGFFYKDADLTAWDSISAHTRGLQVLHKTLSASRTKTTTEPINIPFRHGILHGQDLGYDNKMVAAKAWAALFAIRSWALAARNGRLEEPPPEREPSLHETLKKLGEAKKEQKRISKWAARSAEVIATIPRTGAPFDYDQNSPEGAVVNFLDLWKRRNYGEMAKLLPPMFRERLSQAAGKMRVEFGNKELKSFEIEKIHDEAPAISEIRVQVTFNTDGEPHEGTLECRVSCHSENGNLICRGLGRERWFFYPRLVVPQDARDRKSTNQKM